ncbi:DUF6919 domain-containing protein [Kitasatospora griseola]|uniref:DUF6919 domain-containing protein n=1 Tax=Kitasatospora griseola TaxID=2064 RepID=UPI00341B7357
MPAAPTPGRPGAPQDPAALRTLSEVAATVADWLDGHTRSLTCAAYRIPSDADSGPTRLLAALNRAGLLTVASQYGEDTHFGPEGRTIRRAAVVLLVPGRRLRRRLRTEARKAGLIVSENGVTYFDRLAGLGGVTVSLLDGEPDANFGARWAREDLPDLLPGCHRDVLREAAAARQVTIADPAWGRNDRLWPLLRQFTAPATVRKIEPLDPRERLIHYGESAHLDTTVLEDLTAQTEDALLDAVEQVIHSLPDGGDTVDRQQVLHVLQAMRHRPHTAERPTTRAALRAAYHHAADRALHLTDALDTFHTSLVHGVHPGAGPELVRRALAVAAAAAPLEGTTFPMASENLR